MLSRSVRRTERYWYAEMLMKPKSHNSKIQPSPVGSLPAWLVFTFEDDIFDMLDDPTGAGRWFCGDGCANHDKSVEKLGHYCDAANGSADFDLRWVASWKKRCRDSGSSQRRFVVCGIPGVCGNNWPEAGAEFQLIFYNGIGCLSSFDVIGQARLASKCNGSNAIITTEELHIQGD